MKMSVRRLVIALAAAGLAANAPALAQGALTDAQKEESNCVYMEILDSELFYDIGDDYLIFGGIDNDGETGSAVAAATTACAGKYAWTDEEAKMGSVVAVLRAAADVLAEDALYAVSDEAYEAIFNCYDDLTDADLEQLANATWYTDQQLIGRATAALKKRGFPTSDELIVSDAILMMEIHLSHMLVMNDWTPSLRQ